MKYLIIFLSICFAHISFSQNIAKEYPLQKLLIGDFITVNNDTIKNCFVTYRVFGKPDRDSSNIIFFPTWLGGNSENIGVLISKYSFLDTNKFCIISIDALANGYSSSPSNSHLFPKISFDDLTKVYYLTLTQYLKIYNLFGIVGGSMGGMTAFHFAVKYPNYANRIVSYVSSPKLSSYDLLWTNLKINLIEYLFSINASKRNVKSFSDMITALVSRTPSYLNKTIPVSEFYSYFNKFYKEPDSIYTLENYLAQLKAVVTFNVANDFNDDLETAAKQIKSKLLIIVSESDMMVNPDNAILFADMSNSEIVVLKNNCGHMGVNCEMEKVRDLINNFLNKD